jgi:antitoxin PrlF
LAWLKFIEQDHENHPEQLKPLGVVMFAEIDALVGDVEVDLDQPLDPNDDLR